MAQSLKKSFAAEVEAIASGSNSAGNFLVNWHLPNGTESEFVPWKEKHEAIDCKGCGWSVRVGCKCEYCNRQA